MHAMVKCVLARRVGEFQGLGFVASLNQSKGLTPSTMRPRIDHAWVLIQENNI